MWSSKLDVKAVKVKFNKSFEMTTYLPRTGSAQRYGTKGLRQESGNKEKEKDEPV